MKIIYTFSTYYYLTITFRMPLTKDEQLAQRRERDAVLRQEKREILSQHPILLQRIATLERQVLLLKIENEKLKNANKDENKAERILLDNEIEEIENEVQREINIENIWGKKPVVVDDEDDVEEEILNIPIEPKVEKKVEKKIMWGQIWYEWIDRKQTKRLFNIPQSEKLDDKGFKERANMIFGLLINLGYETKDYHKDVLVMLRDKKITLKGLIKLFEIYQTDAFDFKKILEIIDKHDFPYAEKNHPRLNGFYDDDFTI